MTIHTKAPQRTDMEVSKIEKMVEELFQYYDDIDCAVTVDQRITAKEQAELWLKRTLTEAHHAGIDEAVEIIKEELRNAPLEVQMTKGIIFGKVIKALQNKV